MKPRKKDRHLPSCMYFKHGRHWLVKKGVWTPLSVELPEALQEYARLTQPSGGGISDLIDKVMAHLEKKGELAENTIKQYKISASKLKTILVEFAPHEVKPKDVAAIKTHFADTPNMANRHLSFLRTVFHYALEWQIVDSNPCIGVKRHQEGKRDRYLTDGELISICEAASPAARPIFEVAYYTGQRIGDVLKMTLSDATNEGVYVRQGKTKQRVLIQMSPGLEAALKAARELPRPVRGMTLFCTRRGGRKYAYRTVRDMWDAAVAKANVSDAHLHDLRAKAITDAENQGLDSQALGGHALKSMTLRYIRNKQTIVAKPPSIRQLSDISDSKKRK